AQTPGPDIVRVTVRDLSLDVDIDSDNNDAFGFPEGSAWEELLEDHLYGLGKLIMQNYNTDDPGEDAGLFTPVQLRFAPGLNPTDPTLQVRLEYAPVGPAGRIALWDFDKPPGGMPVRTPVNQGGHYF